METATKGKTYKIGQAAKLLDVKPFVLRFWETEFKHVLVPVRTPAGQRAYTEANVATVREIKRLLYEEGLTIEGAKKRLGQPQGRTAPPAPSPAPVAASIPAQPFAPPAPPAQALLPGPAEPPAQASPQPDSQADPQAAALRATLRDVRAELTAIRDLLAPRQG